MSLLLMRVLCDTWYLIFLLCRLTHSLPWDGASKTPRSSPTARTRDLAPTSPALLIQKRDDPPERCGYLWAQTEWACKPYSTCLWVTNYGAVGCCRDTTNLNTCSIYTSCVDFADLPACSGSCSSDGLILRCTDTFAPSCGTVTYGTQGNYFGFICSDKKYFWDVDYSSINSANQTYLMTDVPRLIGAPSFPTTSSISTSFTLTTSTSSPASSSTTTTSLEPSPGPSPNIGAIVGGAVGGALVLCAIAVALTVIIMRRKRQTATVDNAPSYVSGMNSPTPYTSPVHWNELDGQGRPVVYELPPKTPNLAFHS